MSNRILVLEDDEAIGESITESLSEAGYAAELFNAFADAAAALTERVYDAVILDLALHDESGMTLLQDLSRDQPDVVVVVVSATLDIATRQTCYQNGARDFISKPFHPGELVYRIQRLVPGEQSL